MMKNDITYEYRVFTNRRIDLESMEVGRCTSKVIKELKSKDKVDGRFFHTSDSDEWFFCWNGELQKLNLKGDSDVNAALAEVEKLIGEANVAVSDAKKTAEEANKAAVEAKAAADAASAAVENIENKADKLAVEQLEQKVDKKADSSAVKALEDKVNEIKVPTKVSELENDANYLTDHQDISGKQDVISDLDVIRVNASKGATALQEIPAEYVTDSELTAKGYLTSDSLSGYATENFVGDEIAKIDIPKVPSNVSEFTNDAGYLTLEDADKKYAPIGTSSDGSGSYATQDFVLNEIAKIDIPEVPTKISAFENDANYLTEHQDISGKQDVITDLDVIRANAMLATTALQDVPAEYVTDSELTAKGYLTEHQSLDNYYTKGEIDNMINAINDLIGEATNITNRILA